MRYLVVPEAEHRSKCARAVLAPAEAAAYQQACATIVEPYKNVVRFDGARRAAECVCASGIPVQQHVVSSRGCSCSCAQLQRCP